MTALPVCLAAGVVLAAWLASVAGDGGLAAAPVAAAAGLGLVGLALIARARQPPRPRRNGRAPARLAAAACGVLVLAIRLTFAPPPDPAAAPPDAAASSSSDRPRSATVEAIGSPLRGMQRATLSLDTPGARCSASLPPYPELVPGDTVSWTGRIEPVPDTDFGRWLANQGIGATCEATRVAVERRAEDWRGRLEAFRRASGEALTGVLPEPEAGLAAGILIGLRDRVDRDLAAAFTAAGVSHIVAISGWNIAVVAGAVAAVLSRVRRRRRALATVAAIAAYTLFAGASASVLRAALMAGVALLAAEAGGLARASVALAWAVVLMLVVEPATVGDVGFQLSAAATVGLIAWSARLGAWLERRAAWLPKAVRESLAVSLAAQAATLPIVLLAFGRLAPVSPAVNLVAVPVVPPLMAAGAVALGAGWLVDLGAPGWLGRSLALPAWLLLSVLETVVRAGAALPGANLTLGPPTNAVAAAVAALAVVFAARRRPARTSAATLPRAKAAASRPRLRHPRLLVTAGIVVVLAGCVVARQPDGHVRVTVLDVGQGDAILIEGDRGSRALVDGGPDPGRLLVELDGRIPAWDRRLDAVILTHPHDDHAAGLAAVVERYRVGRVYESAAQAGPVDAPGYRALESAITARSVSRGRLGSGDSLTLDSVELRVLWPDPGSDQTVAADGSARQANRAVNDSSIVLLGTYGVERFLLTGDVEEDVDPVLVERGLPAVDLLKVAHHGSATATSDALLTAVDPAAAVVSVGLRNTYHHPSQATLDRLGRHADRVLRTDRDGSVEAALDGERLTLSSAGPRAAAASGPVEPSPGVLAVAAATPALPSARGVVLTPDADRLGGGSALGDCRRTAGPGELAVAASSTPHRPVGPAALLYDSLDVRPESQTERRAAPVARTAGLAPPPLSGRRGGRGLARARGRQFGVHPRPPPRRGRRAAPRCRQGAARQAFRRRPAARRGVGRLARGGRPYRARAARGGPSGHAARRCGLV